MNGQTTTSRRPFRGPASGIAALIVLCFSVGAYAQTPAPPKESDARPPTAKVADKPPLLGNIVAAVVILGAVVTASLLPSKRGHQD